MSAKTELDISKFDYERVPGIEQILNIIDDMEEDFISVSYKTPTIIDTDKEPVQVEEGFTYGNRGIKVLYTQRPFTIETENCIFELDQIH